MAAATVPDHRAHAWRLIVRLTCQCRSPLTIRESFDGRECRVCRKPIVERSGEELVRLVLAELAS